MSKIVVYGADGFMGRHLVARLAENAQDKIIAFGHFSSYQKGSDHPFEVYKNVQIMPGDFLNRKAVSSVLKGADYVFHLISTTTPATAQSDPFIDVDTNVRGSIRLFKMCAEAQVKKVIYLSSGGAVYGDVKHPTVDELTLPAPRSPYGIAKLTVEHYLRYFKFTHGLNYVVYRVANPYGPGQSIYGKQGVIPIFMHRFLSKDPITIFGDGTMVRDYVYIDDTIDMLVGSYHKANKFNEYNLGSGQGVSVNKLIAAIEHCVGYSVPKKHIETPSTFVQKIVLNTDRFTREFKLQPTTPLEAGIARTWEYVKTIA